MATTLEEILGKTINSTKELRDEIKRLQDELVKTEAGTAQWDETSKKLVAAQERLTSVTRANRVETNAAKDSIVGMEKEYKNLYNQYKLLTEEERKSPFGQEMAVSLHKLSDELNNTKKNVGNFKDNIGRYTQSAVEAFGQMGVSIGGLTGPLNLANGGFKAFNKTLLANPIIWLIAGFKAIIGVFKKVKDAINENEESQMALKEAMSAFQPVIDAVNNGFDKMGQAVVKVIGWLGDAFSKLREIRAAVTDFLGLTKGAKDRVKEENEIYKDLAKSQNDLVKAKREQLKLNATQDAEVKTLLDQAAATTDQKEKLELLNKARETQTQITERNIAIAEEELRILQIEASLTANDAEMNDKLAQAEANVAQARAEGAARTKEMSSQIASLTKSTDDYNNSLEKQKEEANKIYERVLNNSKSELQILEEKYEKEKALLKKFGKDTKQLTEQYEAERRAIEKKYEDERKEAAQAEKENNITQAQRANNEEEAKKELELYTLKQELLKDETRSEIEKAELIKEVEDELFQLKQNNILEELNTLDLTTEEKLALTKEYYDNEKNLIDRNAAAEKEAAEKEKELLEAKQESVINLLNNSVYLADSIGAISDAISENIERTIEDGKITEEQAAKKKKQLKSLEQVQLAVSIAAIAGETASGIMSLWKAYAGKTVTNNTLGLPPAIMAANAVDLASTIAQTAGIATVGAANIAAAIGGYISTMNSITGGSGGGVEAVAPQQIDSTAYTYTRQLQTQQEEEELNTPIWVSVVDIDEGLKKVQVRNEESTF